jgi:hypothetical protein
MKNLFMHRITGSIGTKDEWIEGYLQEELSERNKTAEECFYQDLNETLFPINLLPIDEVK